MLGSTENKITKYKNGKNVPHLEITEVVLVCCNIVNNDYQRDSRKKKNFMATFYGWGSTASRLEQLRGGSLLFTTKFPEISETHCTDHRRMKG